MRAARPWGGKCVVLGGRESAYISHLQSTMLLTGITHLTCSLHHYYSNSHSHSHVDRALPPRRDGVPRDRRAVPQQQQHRRATLER